MCTYEKNDQMLKKSYAASGKLSLVSATVQTGVPFSIID